MARPECPDQSPLCTFSRVEGVKNPRLALAVLAGLIVLGLFVAAFVVTLNAFQDQRATGPRELTPAEVKGFDGIAVLVRVVRVDPTANEGLTDGREGDFAAEGARVRLWVIPTNEELLIARDTVRCLLDAPRRW